MNRKRNVNYIKPEDPEFLKVLKKQAGYDDRNHKFDELDNSEKDFAVDQDSEKPQVVVLKQGDLTAEEAEIEKTRIEKEEAETKADLSQKVVFKSNKINTLKENKRKHKDDDGKSKKKNKYLLSFDEDEDNDDT